MWANQVTITLPGRAVTATLDPSALPRYLLARGWSAGPIDEGDRVWVTYERGDGILIVPNPSEWPAEEIAWAIAENIEEIATIEQRHPLDVLADLLPSTDGPALQWEHMSTTARASTLDAIAALARVSRVDAATWRAVGNTESALAAEGRAMGLEAAVAVLRGLPR